jgi:2-isopropylmalate synthase
MDLILVNLKLLGWHQPELTRLREYCELAAEAVGIPIPPNYPVLGRDAFRTATGVHAAAIIKALDKRDLELADAVYSGVPAHLFGAEQRIEIGPMSGRSNVIFWLRRRGLQASPERVDRIFAAAKAADRLLRDEEILELV